MKKKIVITIIVLIVIITSVILVYIKYNTDIESFIKRSNFSDIQNISILQYDREYDITIFKVVYGKPSDCEAGCIFSKAYGIKHKNKIGWYNLYYSNHGKELKLYDFDIGN